MLDDTMLSSCRCFLGILDIKSRDKYCSCISTSFPASADVITFMECSVRPKNSSVRSRRGVPFVS